MLCLARCPLSTQSIRSDATSARCPLSTQSIRPNARPRTMSTVHAVYPFGRYVWRGDYYLRRVSVRTLDLARRVSVRTLDLARCQLSTQSICPNARSREMSHFHAEYPLGRFVWWDVNHPRKLRSQLPFKRFVWCGVDYPPLQLLYGRYVWRGIYYSRSLRFTIQGEIYLFTQFRNNKLHTQNDVTSSDSMQRIHLKFATREE